MYQVRKVLRYSWSDWKALPWSEQQAYLERMVSHEDLDAEYVLDLAEAYDQPSTEGFMAASTTDLANAGFNVRRI